jgi:hypothetical protein
VTAVVRVGELLLPVANHKDGHRVKGMTAAGRSFASGSYDQLEHLILHLVAICLPSIAT